MYNITELSKMFECTRNTIYNKLKSDELKEYVVKDNKGTKLQLDGLSTLQLMMSKSKSCVDKHKENTQVNTISTDAENELLKGFIEELKRDKQQLTEQLNKQQETINSTLFLCRQQEDRVKLLEGQVQEQSNKKWWKLWN